jgi:hypothetical protein
MKALSLILFACTSKSKESNNSGNLPSNKTVETQIFFQKPKIHASEGFYVRPSG